MGLETDCMLFSPGSVPLYIWTMDKVLLSCGCTMGRRIHSLPQSGADVRPMTLRICQEGRKGFITYGDSG